VEEYRDSKERVNFKEFWRKDIRETKLDKLIKSLGKRMPWLYTNQPPQEQISIGLENTDIESSTSTVAEDLDSMTISSSFVSLELEESMETDEFLGRVKNLLVAW